MNDYHFTHDFFRWQHGILSNRRRSARQLPAAIEGEALNQMVLDEGY